MKRCLTHLTIVGYLSLLAWGIVSHTLKFGTHLHPSMYFVVWDMFCGWAAYDTRNQVIVEGESGKFYEVLPAPWGEIQPYGDLGRRHYDPFQTFCMSMAQNVLKHTDHEPITRIFVLEEAWAKKFNLPDPLWEARYDEPKSPHRYRHVRYVFSSDGVPLQANNTWLTHQQTLVMSRNPRLQAEFRKSRPFVTLGSSEMEQNRLFHQSAPWNANPDLVGSPLGN
jgi:hypothetical protein